jgi:HSP20 family protein
LRTTALNSKAILDISNGNLTGTLIANSGTTLSLVQNQTSGKARVMLVRFQYPRIPNHVLESLFTTDTIMGTTKSPAMDIAEHENELVVTAELPGVKKDQVKVTFDKGILTVDGQRKPSELPKDAEVLLNEMQIRDFSRSIRIDVDIDANNITAELEDGVLSVTLPKKEAAKPKQIEVKVK